MTLTLQELESVEQHWAIQAIPDDTRVNAFKAADERLAGDASGQILQNAELPKATDKDIETVATAYEIAATEGLSAVLHSSQGKNNKVLKIQTQAGAHKAFGLYRVLPVSPDDDYRIFHVLRLASLAYCGERQADLERWFNDSPQTTKIPSIAGVQWDKRLLYKLFDCWIRLLWKRNKRDINRIPEIVLGLHNDQSEFESRLIKKQTGREGRAIALRLISLYHFTKATERLAFYMLKGETATVGSEIDRHFEAAIKASNSCLDMQLEMTLNWLYLASRKMTEGSS